MLKILFTAQPERWDEYRSPLEAAFRERGLNVELNRDHMPEEVDYIICAPNGPVKDFSRHTRAKAVLNLWAGVETIVNNKTLTQPLCRMVDTGMTRGMVEWVCGHVLRHHIGMDVHIHGQDGVWRNEVYPPIAADRPVTLLGIGELGSACGQALSGLGFPVRGWSRSQKSVPGLTCFHGADGLRAALTDAQVVILLLPDTPDTTGILNRETLGWLTSGAFVLNPGRGALIDDAALLLALDSGQIEHATLDAFTTEPLHEDHPYWAHPKVTVTPHIASTTRPKTAARVIAENICRGESGQPFLHLVDRSLGY